MIHINHHNVITVRSGTTSEVPEFSEIGHDKIYSEQVGDEPVARHGPGISPGFSYGSVLPRRHAGLCRRSLGFGEARAGPESLWCCAAGRKSGITV